MTREPGASEKMKPAWNSNKAVLHVHSRTLTLDEDSGHTLCPNEHKFGESLCMFNNTKIRVSVKTM